MSNKKQTPSEYLREAAEYMNKLAKWLERFENNGGVQTEDDSSNPPGNPPPPPGPGHG